MRAEPAPIRLAGLLWLLAGLSYLTCEAVAAAAFPGYSYANNYISDLGVPYEGMAGDRPLRSGLASVMNLGGFILDGLLFGAASLVAFRAVRGGRIRSGQGGGRLFLALALVHSLGTILVGLVHSGDREVAAGIHHWHVVGAAMAIIGGNAALIAASGAARRLGAPAAYRIASLALGIFGLLSLALLEVGAVTGAPVLPDGLVERMSVYPITAWEIMTGLGLLVAGRRVVLSGA